MTMHSDRLMHSDTLLTAAVHLAAAQGWSDATPAAVARHSGTSEAAALRRWPDREALAIDVVATAVLLPTPPDAGGLAVDLSAVVAGLEAPLSPGETAVSGLLGDPGWSFALGFAVATALDRAAQRLLTELVARAVERGEPAQVSGRAVRTVRSLLVHRLAAGPLSRSSTVHLVDGLLLPALSEAGLSRV